MSTIFLLRNYCFHLNKNVISAGLKNQQPTTFDCSVVFIGTMVRQNTHPLLYSLLVQNKRSTCDDAGPNFKAPIYGCQGNMCTILRGERENPFRESGNHDNCRRIFLTAHESRDERIVVGNTRVPKFTMRTKIDSADVHRNLFRCTVNVLKEEKYYYIITIHLVKDKQLSEYFEDTGRKTADVRQVRKLLARKSDRSFRLEAVDVYFQRRFAPLDPANNTKQLRS